MKFVFEIEDLEEGMGELGKVSVSIRCCEYPDGDIPEKVLNGSAAAHVANGLTCKLSTVLSSMKEVREREAMH